MVNNIEGYSRDTTVKIVSIINNDKTNTIFHYSHAQLSDWFIAMYLFYIPTFGTIN